MPILHNPTDAALPVPQLGDRERIAEGGRRICGVVILAAGDALDITEAEAALFAGNSIFHLEV